MKKTEVKSSRSPWKIVMLGANVLLLIGLAGFGGFYFTKYRQVMNDPAKYIDVKKYVPTVEEENKVLVDKISKLINLPAGEEPKVAKVKDAEALKKDPFFVDAQNGDNLVIYQTAGLAVLYRELDNKIIKAGPVVLPNSELKKVAVIASESDVTSVGQRLKSDFATQAVLGETSQPKVSHDRLIVVDLSGSNGALAQSLATALGGSVQADFPEGETKPTADLVVIGVSEQP